MAGVLYARVGGAWVPVAGGSSGTDEVAISPSQPADSYELWVDTDEPTVMTDDMRWNTAWGIVALGSMKASVYGVVVASGTVFTDPLVFTSVPGRRYRVRVAVRAAEPNAVPNGLYSTIRKNGASAGETHHTYWASVASGYAAPLVEVVFAGDGTTATWDAAMFTLAGTATAYRAYTDQPSSYFYIEDVGPVSGSLPTANPTPPWVNLPLLNGWTSYDLGRVVQYRKVGDMVQLRGLAKPGSNTVLGLLPVGNRPPSTNQAWSCARDGATPTIVEITQAGYVGITAPYPAYVWLDPIQFSVTL